MILHHILQLLSGTTSPYAGAFDRNEQIETETLAAAHQWLDTHSPANDAGEDAAEHYALYLAA